MDNITLFKQLHTEQDPHHKRKIRDTLILQNKRLVYETIHKKLNIQKNKHFHLTSFEDLSQVGMVGLIKAVDRFDPYKSSAFSTYAINYIRGEILHYIRDKSQIIRIPCKEVELYQKIKRVAFDQNIPYTKAALEFGLNPSESWFLGSCIVFRYLDYLSGYNDFPVEIDAEQELLNDVLSFLDEEDIWLLQQHYVERRNYTDISKQTGVPTRHIKWAIKLALNHARKVYEMLLEDNFNANSVRYPE